MYHVAHALGSPVEGGGNTTQSLTFPPLGVGQGAPWNEVVPLQSDPQPGPHCSASVVMFSFREEEGLTTPGVDIAVCCVHAVANLVPGPAACCCCCCFMLFFFKCHFIL